METIYIDRLFVLNLVIDYLLLLGTARVCGHRLRRWRYLIAAAAGALYAVFSVMPHSDFLTEAPIKLAAGVFMAIIAFGSEERFFRSSVVFFSVSAFFGGAVWAVSGGNGSDIKNTLYLPVSMPVLALSFGLCYAALSLAFCRLGKTGGRKVHKVNITLSDRSIELRALEDSGNTLFDPISGSSVLIASADTLLPLFPDCAEALMLIDPADQLTALTTRYGERFRLIPYTAVGTRNGMLTAFRPDLLVIDGKIRDDIVTAVSTSHIGGDAFDAII